MQKLDAYRGLFAQDGGFDIPSSRVAAVAVRRTASLDLLADVQQVRYSEVKSIGNTMLPNLMRAPLGSASGAGFGWQDMTTYKLGVPQRVTSGWAWRAGYSYGQRPIPPHEVMFNILAPGVEEHHASFGITRTLGRGRPLSLAVTRAFSNTVSGPNPLEAPGQQQIGLQMNQWDVQVGYAFTFGR